MAITKVTNSLVSVNAIHGTLIADNAITSVHIAQNQVTSVQIPDSSITSTQLAANSVDTAELISGSIDAIHLASDSVTTAKILDANVTTAKIANNAITSALIPDGSITDAQLGSGAFTMGTITTTGAIRGPASLTIDPATVGDNTGTVVIAGNLQVDGTTTTVNSTTLDVADKNITIGKGQNEAGSGGSGITVDGSNATILWDETNTSWDFNNPVTIEKAATADMLIAETTSNNTRSFLTTKSKDSSGNSLQLKLGTLGDGPYGMLFTFTNHPLTFATNNAAPQMTLATNGNLGIGAGTNDARLQVKNNSSSYWAGYLWNQHTNGTGLHVETNSYGTEELLRLSSLNGSGGSNRVRMSVRANGNVGIGPTTPAQTLHVSSTGATSNGIRISNSEGSFETRVDQGEFYLYDVDDNRIPFLIDTDGKIGMGTNDPARNLHIKGTQAIIHLESTTDNQNCSIWFDSNVGGSQTDKWEIGTNISAAAKLQFFDRVNNTSVMTLEHGGKVGIGTDTPDTNLEVDIQNGADGNGIHITSTSTTNDPTLKLTRNGSADRYQLMIRGTAGSARLGISAGTNLDSGLNRGSNNGLSIGTAGAAGAGGLLVDNDIKTNSRFGVGSAGNISTPAFYHSTDADTGLYFPAANTIGLVTGGSEKLRIKGDVTAQAKFGATYIESLYTPNGGVQNCRIFEDHLGKWVAVGYFAANAATSIQSTFSSVRGGPTTDGQSGTTQFSADWGDSYPTEVRYMGASDFKNFNETKTIDFIHGVPVGRPWKNFFNNAQRRPDAATPHSGTTHMGSVQGAVGSEKYGWECRGAYDGRGRWHNPSYTHHRMSDTNASTHVQCPTAAFTTATSNAFVWNTYSDAKISVHHSNDYSGQDTASYSAAFGRDDTVVAFFDDYPNSRNNMQSSTNNYGTAVYVLMKLPEMQSIGLQGARSRDHQPGEIVQTKVYERNSDISATSGLTGDFGYLDFTPKYGNSLLEFNVHANTGSNDGNTVIWYIYQGSSSAIGTLLRRTGNQIINNDGNTDGQELPFSWTQYYQLNDDKKSSYRYRVRFSASGATYWGHTYGSTAHSYFTIKEIKQEHNATGITD